MIQKIVPDSGKAILCVVDIQVKRLDNSREFDRNPKSAGSGFALLPFQWKRTV